MNSIPLLMGELYRASNDDRGQEVQGAVIIILLGVWFMVPQWAIYESCPQVYQFMQWLPEGVWGICFMLIGVMQMAALVTAHRWLRRHVLLLKGAVWIMLALTVGFGDHTAPAFPIYLLFAFFALKNFLRIGK